MCGWKNKSGFSLFELMVTVVIVMVLAVIAVSSYQKHVIKAKLAEAYTALATMEKGEISYYNEYGEFNNLFDRAPLSIVPLMTTPAEPYWDHFLLPIPSGTRVNFGYNAIAGKTTSSMAQLGAGDSIHGIGFSAVNYPFTLRGCNDSLGSCVYCNQGIYSAAFLGAVLVPNYDWVVISAVGNLDNQIDTTCTAVGRLIDASPASGRVPKSTRDFISVNVGE